MKKRTLKRLGTGILAAVMVLGMGMTAFAEDTYTVTINPTAHVSTPDSETEDASSAEATRFEAYQIFAGTVNEASVGASEGELGNIAWGTGISNAASFVNALVASNVSLSSLGISDLDDSVYEDAETLGGLFKARLEAGGYTVGTTVSNENDPDMSKSAVVIGQVLSDFTAGGNNTTLAEAFAKIASGYLSTNKVSSKWTGTNWQVTGLSGGYYIIKDNGSGTTGTSVFSDFLVGVYGNTTVTTKGDAPTVTKTISSNNKNGNAYGSDFEQGQKIEFTLTGTLPSNFLNYNHYKYVFHDTLASGLTYVDGSVAVTVTTTDGTATITNAVTVKKDTVDDTCTIEFGIADLKASTVTGLLGGESIPNSATVTVTYKAYLNDTAALTKDANTNTVHLEYSNDPNWSGSGTEPTGDTPDKTVYVYNFGMNIHKYDASVGEDTALDGAGFVLKNADSKYAVFRNTGTTYDLVGWMSADNVNTLKTTATSWEHLNETLNASKDTYLTDIVGTPIPSGTYAIVMESATATDIAIEGLADGTYKISEVYAPNGYDPLTKDITIVYEAEYYEAENLEGKTAGTIKNLTVTVDDDDPVEIVKNGEYQESYDKLIYAMSVANYPVMKAPGTGGAGVYLFYGIGAVLIIAAVSAFIIAGRKKKEA